jgi:hypothetical protein
MIGQNLVLCLYPGEIPFVTKKSSRSDIFAGSVGQYIGLPLRCMNNCYLAQVLQVSFLL